MSPPIHWSASRMKHFFMSFLVGIHFLSSIPPNDWRGQRSLTTVDWSPLSLSLLLLLPFFCGYFSLHTSVYQAKDESHRLFLSTPDTSAEGFWALKKRSLSLSPPIIGYKSWRGHQMQIEWGPLDSRQLWISNSITNTMILSQVFVPCVFHLWRIIDDVGECKITRRFSKTSIEAKHSIFSRVIAFARHWPMEKDPLQTQSRNFPRQPIASKPSLG